MKNTLITTENGREETYEVSLPPLTPPSCYPDKRAKIYAACPFCDGHLEVFGEDINEYTLCDCNVGIYIQCHECGEPGQTIIVNGVMHVAWDNSKAKQVEDRKEPTRSREDFMKMHDALEVGDSVVETSGCMAGYQGVVYIGEQGNKCVKWACPNGEFMGTSVTGGTFKVFKQKAVSAAGCQAERELLRKEQSRRAMPVIGGLLDVWEGMPNDLKSMPELEDLMGQLQKLDNAMDIDNWEEV